MNKSLLPCLILLIAAVSGCTEEPETSPNATMNQTTVTVTITPAFPVLKPSTVYVEILGSKFDPPELKVVNGTTVEWKNSDSAMYVLNVDNSSSPNLLKRSTWNFTFNRTGIFEYNCSLHPSMPGGRIIVEAAGKEN